MLFFAVFCLVCLIETSSSVDSSMERLREYIMIKSKYDKHARPDQSSSSNTTVSVATSPYYILDYDEEKSLLTLDALLRMEWYDPRLKWKQSDYGGHNQLHFENGEIWQPEILVYNGHSSNMDPKADARTLATSIGKVYWIPPATFNTHCHPQDLHLYPYDAQKCKIILGLWTENGFQIDLQISEHLGGLDFSLFVNSNPRWDLVQRESNISRIVNMYDCCEEPYITIELRLHLQRRYPAHLSIAWLSCVLIMVLTLSIFWIPLFSGKKIILGGFLFLVTVVIMVYVASLTKPSSAQYYAVSFVRNTMCAVVAAIVVEILIMNMASIGHPYKPPGFLIKVVSSTVAKWLLVWSPLQPTESMDHIHLQDDETDNQATTTNSFKHEWVMVATAIDRILFIIFLVVFLAIH